MVPVLYAIYLAAIYHLPNRAYFSNLEPWVQLHFVLRNAYAIVQSTLTLWVMYVLQTSLEHAPIILSESLDATTAPPEITHRQIRRRNGADGGFFASDADVDAFADMEDAHECVAGLVRAQ
ncbi:uncharacterized protein IUM83_01947 [Phytophthora cinnamomi]|uniref:uncharacterized protein n=1 Tax=Phytophthora cinnamomi TaxID=4785 RepID=UPI00355A4533|nr:hypothetical protein IUM83_01947 [Phytophthora cinnamomi]